MESVSQLLSLAEHLESDARVLASLRERLSLCVPATQIDDWTGFSARVYSTAAERWSSQILALDASMADAAAQCSHDALRLRACAEQQLGVPA